MGDPSLLREYHEDLRKEKEAKKKKFASLGIKTNKEVAEITSILLETVRKYARILNITYYTDFNKYGWTDEDINRLVITKINAGKEAARKQWVTKRKIIHG